MTVQSIPTPTTEKVPATTSDTRLHGRWLLVARIGWLVFAALTLVVFVASMPVYFTQVQTICRTTTCPIWEITPHFASSLQQLGTSLGGYAATTVVMASLLELVAFVVGVVIFWRRSDERVALVVALFLVMFICDFNNNLDALAALHPAWTLPVRMVNCVGGLVWSFVFYLFPDGRFVPRWTRWPAVVSALISVPANLFPGSVLDVRAQFGDLYSVYLAVQAFGLVGLQLYRYVRVSTPIQRQQTKWVVFGVGTTFLLAGGLNIADPSLANGAPQSIVDLLLGIASSVLIALVPLSFGIAILRYRLWDVDALINKALVYGLLTGLLGALYAGLIIGLGSLLGLVSGQSSQPLVFVLSTLAVAVLFQPVRRRIQAIIDRRFYRKKYDAEKTLAAFSATLRNEVNLEQVCEQLLGVVQETMQPVYVSLWLRQPGGQRPEPTREVGKEVTTQ